MKGDAEILIAKKGKTRTEQVALWRRNGEERARQTPKAPTKVEVVGYWPKVEKGGGKQRPADVINVSLQG
jgi:hypothetical protein